MGDKSALETSEEPSPTLSPSGVGSGSLFGSVTCCRFQIPGMDPEKPEDGQLDGPRSVLSSAITIASLTEVSGW